jgi:Zn-dependent peptidase ImmA (M78 family)
MIDRRHLSLDAEKAALRTRRAVGCAFLDSLCPYDAADHLGIDLWFMDLPGSEGVFEKAATSVIVVSSMRPAGRRAFTCAHELGHFVFGHGTSYDQLINQPLETQAADAEEFLADRFASFFLMPKTAVANGFVRRGWDIKACTPIQVYTLASWLGVGYTTLIFHLERGIRLISNAQARLLLPIAPKRIRAEILPASVESDLYIVDTHWTGRAVDAQVGDFMLLPAGTTFLGNCVQQQGEHAGQMVFSGSVPGLGQFRHPSGWASFVRISRRGFIGRGKYRHLEDPDAD